LSGEKKNPTQTKNKTDKTQQFFFIKKANIAKPTRIF